MEKSLVTRDSPALKKLKAAAESGKKGNYRAAVKILGELICETDAPPEAWLLLGRSFHALKEYSRALAAFNDYIKQRPAAGDGYLFAGRTYLALGLPYRAVPFLRKALENSPGDSRTQAMLGMAYLKSKNSQAAVQILQEAVEAAPADRRIYRAYLNSLVVRGMRLCDIDEHELGLRMLRFVLENGAEAGIPENTFLRLALGRAARDSGNLEEALEHFTCALKLTKDDTANGTRARNSGASNANVRKASRNASIVVVDGDRRIRWARASILIALGRNAQAGKEIETIRSGDAGVPELPWNSELVDLFIIRSYIESGQWRRAAELCRHWLANREDRSIIRVFFAEALRNLSDFSAAHNHLQRALEKTPNELELWYADILVSWEGRDYQSLKRALRAAKSLNGDPGIIERFSVLHQVKISGDVPGNIELLQNAIRTLGTEPELMHCLGEAYMEADMPELAQGWFEKTIRLKANHESARLGEITALQALLDSGERLPAPARTPKRGKTARDTAPNIAARLGSRYKAYLKRWPDNVNIRRERALFLVKTFEYAEASGELEKLLVWEPSNPSLRRVLAYTYRKTGRCREAAVFLKALLREKPKDIGLLIEYTGCLERAGAAHYAQIVLEKARELFTASADIPLALGILSIRGKNTEKAFAYFREAAALDTRDPRPYQWMADIYRTNGNRAAAERYAEEAEMRKKSINRKK